MTKTPRTDAAFAEWWLKEAPYEDLVKVARQLESENAELRAALLRIARIDAGLDAWHEDAMPTAMTEARALLAKVSA